LASTLSTSSSVSSRAALPETSSVWIAANSMRSVAVRNFSWLFIASVRSDLSRSLSSAMGQTLPVEDRRTLRNTPRADRMG
jgi:hypothetical protein